MLFHTFSTAGALLEMGRFEEKNSEAFRNYQKMRNLTSKTLQKRNSATWKLYSEYKQKAKFIKEICRDNNPFDYEVVIPKLAKEYPVNFILRTCHNLDDRVIFEWPQSHNPSLPTVNLLLSRVSDNKMHASVIKVESTKQCNALKTYHLLKYILIF